jgi:hypothetical protein
MLKHVLKDADERCRSDSKSYKKQDVELEVVLRRGAVRTINVQLRKSATHTHTLVRL